MAQVLRHLPTIDDPRVLVTAATRDDAAVFRVSHDRAVVASVDFFTPIVDDAYTFGAIAAANAFSDVYAMGGTPAFALSLVGWPRNPEMLALLEHVVKGATDVAARAGTFILGGHSIDDKEPKFGLVAFGEVRPDEVVTLDGAKRGDRLVLTKPLGTGILSTALKREQLTEADMQAAIDAMLTLNDGACRAMRSVGRAVHAATDVTGFGLIGHLHNMLEASGVRGQLTAAAAPVFKDVTRLAAAGMVPGGTTRNYEAADAYVHWDAAVTEEQRTILCDAQTSGGLLIAVDPAATARLVEALKQEQTPAAAVVGEVVDGTAGTIRVEAAADE